METEKKFISQIADSQVHKLSMINMLTQVMNDLNTHKMSILAGLAGAYYIIILSKIYYAKRY